MCAVPWQEREKLPMYAQEPFQKQITRVQAVNSKLLEDIAMTRFLLGATGNLGTNDLIYEPNDRAQSHSKNYGHVRTFGSQVGRLELNRVGTRAAANGIFPSNWYPSKAPNDSMTRPCSASSGIKFEKQITRRQDVNGKLLENLAMTRFLFGAGIQTGPEHYDGAYDTMMNPGSQSHLKKIGQGQHHFRKQCGRLPLNRVGTRAAANGIYPSHWEPGAGYTATFVNTGKKQMGFDRQVGRVELHLSGMRGAPARADLAADFNPSGGGGERPQSAMAQLRAAEKNDGFGKKKSRSRSAAPMNVRPEKQIIYPASMKRNIQTANFGKQLTREQWTSQVIRGAG